MRTEHGAEEEGHVKMAGERRGYARGELAVKDCLLPRVTLTALVRLTRVTLTSTGRTVLKLMAAAGAVLCALPALVTFMDAGLKTSGGGPAAVAAAPIHERALLAASAAIILLLCCAKACCRKRTKIYTAGPLEGKEGKNT